ncbi:MAG: hypothetical protein BMS9Abin08_0757 [Gammaproteobacteria bacterium]|nr:MAG: hypothetical protein BMS9Abin08_0757 [Gammaproteobacteria bacterium]
MTKKQKLELTWIKKNERLRLELPILLEYLELPILLEYLELSYHALHRVSETDSYNNILIHCDNLLALKALEQEYAGSVKCAFINPPCNTGSAFAHYDNGVEHSLWLY